MSGVERLAKVAWIEEGQTAHEFVGAFVTGVNSDGTLRISYLDEEHPSVAAMSNYTNRQIGDNVVIRSNGDHWIVLGKIGIPDALPGEGPPPPVIGTILPTASQLYISQFGDGWFDTQDPHSDRKQGVDPFGDMYASCWVYGETLRDAIIAGSFTKVEIKFVRGALGPAGSVSPTIWLHQQATIPADLVIPSSGPYSGPALAKSTEGWWDMPSSMIATIKGGANWRGFYMAAETAAEYFLCNVGSGAGFTGEVRTTT